MPAAPGEPFELVITEQELTELVLAAAAKDVEVKVQWLTARIDPDHVVLRAFVLLKWAGPEAWVQVEADGVPFVENEQVRFHVDRLWIKDYNQYLLANEVPWVTRILNECFSFLQPTRHSEAWPVDLRVQRVALREGALWIQGFRR